MVESEFRLGIERPANVRVGSQAEVTPLDCDVRFTPKSGHSQTPTWSLLRANRVTSHCGKTASVLVPGPPARDATDRRIETGYCSRHSSPRDPPPEGPMAIKIVRRKFIAGLGSAAVWPLAVRAQQPAKPPTIGFLGPLTPSVQSEWTAAFVQRMHEHGWIDGRTIAIEYRWADGRSERFAGIAAEFV